MAYYNINEVIRLPREAKGISQEELCFEICSTVTLSGYENGKHAFLKSYSLDKRRKQ